MKPRRPPTSIDVERVREMSARGLTAAAMAAELGCSEQGVHICRRKNNIPRRPGKGGRPKIDTVRLREMVDAGMTDPEIAADLRVSVVGVRQARDRLQIAAAVRKGHSVGDRNRQLVDAFGLPRGFSLLQLRVLAVLSHGPAVWSAIRERCGLKPCNWGCRNHASKRSNLVELRAEGFITTTYPGRAKRGRVPGVHALTRKAIDLLSQARPSGAVVELVGTTLTPEQVAANVRRLVERGGNTD